MSTAAPTAERLAYDLGYIEARFGPLSPEQRRLFEERKATLLHNVEMNEALIARLKARAAFEHGAGI